jgi:hypothetical protein
MGNSDIHLAGQLGTHTVVRAEERSVSAILKGLRAGHSWIAGSTAVWLAAEAVAGGHAAGIGDRLPTHGAPVTVTAEIGGVPWGTVSVHTERGTVHRAPLSEDGRGTVEWRTSAEESPFARLEVRDSEGRLAALTNPVILD